MRSNIPLERCQSGAFPEKPARSEEFLEFKWEIGKVGSREIMEKQDHES